MGDWLTYSGAFACALAVAAGVYLAAFALGLIVAIACSALLVSREVVRGYILIPRVAGQFVRGCALLACKCNA